jgi:hypothetical protein
MAMATRQDAGSARKISMSSQSKPGPADAPFVLRVSIPKAQKGRPVFFLTGLPDNIFGMY